MASLITFRDYDPWFKPDNTGHNKSGYVSNEGMVIYPVRLKVVAAPLEKIMKREHQILRFSADLNTQKIEDFFTKNQRNQDLFFRGLRAIGEGDIQFFENPIRLPILAPLRMEEFNEKWVSLRSVLQTGDLIFTVDTTSFVSKLIAAVDRGTWSHVGAYVGDGNICEAITRGVVERPIENYQLPRYRLGVYRPSQDSGRFASFMRRQVGKPYNYFGVIRLGFKKIFSLPRRELSPKNISPNDLAVFGDLKLVFLI